jgi:hypothetical protein
MASLPLSGRSPPEQTQNKQPGAHRPGTRASRNKGVKVMGFVVLLFFVAIAIASGFGLTADSRDSADWKPTLEGVRDRDRY